jgi:hypothetical protein
MAHGDAREEKWRGNKRMERVTSKRHMTAEHRLARVVQTLQADVHSSPASSRLNWRPCRFKWTRPFRRKTKSGFCACAITFQTQSTTDDLKMTVEHNHLFVALSPIFHIRELQVLTDYTSAASTRGTHSLRCIKRGKTPFKYSDFSMLCF